MPNFQELNFKEVYTWSDRIAWSFFRVNLNEEYWQLWSGEYPSEFFIKTKSWNVYKIFQPSYSTLWDMTNWNDEACRKIISWQMDRCIFNPRTRKIVGIENSLINCGESFAYAPQCTTSPITEIVGLSISASPEVRNIWYRSNIAEEFKQVKK